MNNLEIITVPVIAGIVYFVMAVYKKLVSGQSQIWTNLIPVWASILGIALGLLAYFFVPDSIVADNVLAAILQGLASGLVAVGVNQVYKQATKASSDKQTKTTVQEDDKNDEA